MAPCCNVQYSKAPDSQKVRKSMFTQFDLEKYRKCPLTSALDKRPARKSIDINVAIHFWEHLYALSKLSTAMCT